MKYETEVDAYGMPVAAFGDRVPSDFFEVLGRFLSVHGKIEYLKERLDHLPMDERTGFRKAEQFLERCRTGQADRNAIVHSHWMFGAHKANPEIILAVRYRTRKHVSGEIATLSIVDVPESDKEQGIGQYTLDSLRKILARSIVTMRIGEQAYSEVMVNWAVRQTAVKSASTPTSIGKAV